MVSESDAENAAILTDVNYLQVPQGQRAYFKVKLSAPPENGKLAVAVARTSGTEGIDVLSGTPLSF